MKLLFVHDHPFYEDENHDVFTGGAFPANLWNNYLINFKTVNVYTRRSNSLASRNTLSSGNKRVIFSLTKLYNSVPNLLRNYTSIKNEIRNLASNSDIILVRLPSVLGFIAAGIVIQMNKPIWVEQVGNSYEALGTHGSILGKLAAPIFNKLNKYYAYKADFITYVTESKLQLDYPKNDHAITESLSNVIIEKILKFDQIANDRFISKSMKIGLIGGFDVKYKGQDILLDAINILPSEIKNNIELYLVGKGNFDWIVKKASKLNLRDNIKYIGSKKAGLEVNEFLKDLTLYVQPSLTEGMPRATIEAMAMGCPVIGSNAGGIPDIVNKRFIHKIGDYKGLSDHILVLFNNREILIEESMSSLKKAEPFISSNLRAKRFDFYTKMNKYLNAN